MFCAMFSRAIADVMSKYEPRIPEVKLTEKDMVLSGMLALSPSVGSAHESTLLVYYVFN